MDAGAIACGPPFVAACAIKRESGRLINDKVWGNLCSVRDPCLRLADEDMKVKAITSIGRIIVGAGRHSLCAVIVVAMMMLLVMSGCSTKKNTAKSRFWQAFTTRYNVYYNGESHYITQLKSMEDNYQDDYTKRVLIHPAEARANEKATQPSGDFTRTIEKMQKAIQLHSIKKKPKKKSGKQDAKYKEWLNREEYNPFLHNAWLLMGRAQYMNGDFLGAASTMHYTARHFQWLPDVVAEAELWEVRSYCAMGWLSEAENVASHIHRDKITKGSVRSLYDLTMANYYIKSNQDTTAIPYLESAIKKTHGSQRIRLNYLLGQLYYSVGNREMAYKAFKRVSGASGATYRTQFNARIKQSEVYSGGDIEKEVKALRRMTRYDRNSEYLDQIYYAIGNLYLSRQDTVNAVENYILAAQKSTRNGIDKAISQLTLGGIYFAQHKYVEAQVCYAEAITQVGSDYPDYKTLKRRSDVLDELAVYAQNVSLQDSLLTLSLMTPEEQLAVAQRMVDELIKREKQAEEDAKREEYLAEVSANNTQTTNANAPTTFTLNTDDSWYFYNSSSISSGKTAFQKAWGNRKLEDDWRRRNKATFAFSDFDYDDESSDSEDEDSQMSQLSPEQADSIRAVQEKLAKADDPHSVEYYLKNIPQTEEERTVCRDIIQEGLYNMGLILKDKLEDLPAAIEEFNSLLARFPDNIYRLDVYYNLYLVYMRMGDEVMAENYRQLIITEFAQSAYGQAMRDPNYFENLRNMERDQETLYQQAYDAYLSNRNDEVHSAYEYMNTTYPLSKILPKFMFIHALAYVTENNFEMFRTTLKDLLARYPETDITPMASGMLKQIAQGRKLQGGGSNFRGMIWTTRLTNDTTAADIERRFTPFSEGQDKPQYYVFAYPTDTVSANELLYTVALHNFNSFVVKDFDLEQMTFGRIGLLIVKGFENFYELTHYKSVLDNDENLIIPPAVRQVMISVDNFNLLLNEGRSLEDYFQYLEYGNEEQVEASAGLTDDDTEAEDGGEADGGQPVEGGEPPTGDSDSHDDTGDAGGTENADGGQPQGNQGRQGGPPDGTPPGGNPPDGNPPGGNPPGGEADR